MTMVKACDKCQRFANALKSPPEELTPLSSPWLFAQWGVDIVGPLPPKKRRGKVCGSRGWLFHQMGGSARSHRFKKYHSLSIEISGLPLRTFVCAHHWQRQAIRLPNLSRMVFGTQDPKFLLIASLPLSKRASGSHEQNHPQDSKEKDRWPKGGLGGRNPRCTLGLPHHNMYAHWRYSIQVSIQDRSSHPSRNGSY